MKRLTWLWVLLLCGLSIVLGQPQAEAAYGMTAEEPYPQVVEREELENLARNTLSLTMMEIEEVRRYSFETVSVPRELRLPEGEYRIEVILPQGVRYWGNTQVQFNAIVDGKPFRKVIGHFKIHVFDQVAVAARLLVAGKPLEAGDFRFEEKEIGSGANRFITGKEAILGMVLSRPVQPGQVILKFMLHRPVIIEAGKQVTIMGKSGAAVVRMDGVAVDRGRVGDVIRVRNVLTGRIVEARVLDDHTVEVVK